MKEFFNIDDNSKFDYPRAGVNAHPLVQRAVNKFRNLPENIKSETPLLYWLLGSGTPPYKMSKKGSDYIHKPVKGQKCGNCRFAYSRVVDGKIICSQISGEIKPLHWCRLWVGGDTIKKK